MTLLEELVLAGNRTKKEIVGSAGEIAYTRVFGGVRHTHKYSQDGDIEHEDGKKIEVKTQVPWYTKEGVTFPLRQANKMTGETGADKIVFLIYHVNDPIMEFWEVKESERSKYSETKSFWDPNKFVWTPRGFYSMNQLKKICDYEDKEIYSIIRMHTGSDDTKFLPRYWDGRQLNFKSRNFLLY